MVLNNLLANIEKDLESPWFDNFDQTIENIEDIVFKTILKYENQPRILAIRKHGENQKFCLKKVTTGHIARQLQKLDKTKVSQSTDIHISF